MLASYLLIVTVVTSAGEIKERPYPLAGSLHYSLQECQNDLKFYKERWPKNDNQGIYFRCDELKVQPHGFDDNDE